MAGHGGLNRFHRGCPVAWEPKRTMNAGGGVHTTAWSRNTIALGTIYAPLCDGKASKSP